MKRDNQLRVRWVVWVCFVGRMGVREMDMVCMILDKTSRQMLLSVGKQNR